MTDLPRHSVSVTGIVFRDDGRVLAIQRDDDLTWVPPGGVLELGETIHDGLRREIKEETGLDVEPVALTGVYKNMTRGIIALVFRCKITGGELITTDETAAYRWVSQDQLCELADEAYAIRVLDALHADHTPGIREHDGKHLL